MRSNVGAGLLAKAVCQSTLSSLIHSLREQARSHIWTLSAAYAPWHFLNFFSLPHGQGSLRPTSFRALRTGSW